MVTAGSASVDAVTSAGSTPRTTRGRSRSAMMPCRAPSWSQTGRKATSRLRIVYATSSRESLPATRSGSRVITSRATRTAGRSTPVVAACAGGVGDECCRLSAQGAGWWGRCVRGDVCTEPGGDPGGSVVRYEESVVAVGETLGDQRGPCVQGAVSCRDDRGGPDIGPGQARADHGGLLDARRGGSGGWIDDVRPAMHRSRGRDPGYQCGQRRDRVDPTRPWEPAAGGAARPDQPDHLHIVAAVEGVEFGDERGGGDVVDAVQHHDRWSTARALLPRDLLRQAEHRRDPDPGADQQDVPAPAPVGGHRPVRPLEMNLRARPDARQTVGALAYLLDGDAKGGAGRRG